MTDEQREVINTYDQLRRAGGGIAIMVSFGGIRETYVNGWQVMKVDAEGQIIRTDPNPKYADRQQKWFSSFDYRALPFHERQKRAFVDAAKWVEKTYGEAGPWVRNRMGDFLPERIHKAFPLRRRKKLTPII